MFKNFINKLSVNMLSLWSNIQVKYSNIITYLSGGTTTDVLTPSSLCSSIDYNEPDIIVVNDNYICLVNNDIITEDTLIADVVPQFVINNDGAQCNDSDLTILNPSEDSWRCGTVEEKELFYKTMTECGYIYDPYVKNVIKVIIWETDFYRAILARKTINDSWEIIPFYGYEDGKFFDLCGNTYDYGAPCNSQTCMFNKTMENSLINKYKIIWAVK